MFDEMIDLYSVSVCVRDCSLFLVRNYVVMGDGLYENVECDWFGHNWMFWLLDFDCV